MKVGDLVRVDYNTKRVKNVHSFFSLVLDIDNGEYHPNGLQLVKVLERGQEQWYPLGYIEVINEGR